MNKKWMHKGHEFDERGSVLSKKKIMVLWGNPYYAQTILEMCTNEKVKKHLGFQILIVNQDVIFQKNGYMGMPVESPEILLSMDKEDMFFVICAMKAAEEIKSNIVHMGVAQNNIFGYKEFLYTYLSVYLFYAKNMLFFTAQNIVPSTFCNLNCRYCLNFTPYISKPIVDNLPVVKEDISLFFEQVDLVYRFNVCGGEPFLNPDLGNILSYIAEKFPDKYIVLETVTNGTVCPDDALCEILKKYNVLVTVDDYRENVALAQKNYTSVIQKLQKYNIRYEDSHIDKWIFLYSGEENGITDEKELQNFYSECNCPWSSLRNGEISGCTYAHFATKAGVIERDEDGYFSLKGKVNKRELLEFRLGYNRKGYVEFCKKCKGYYLSDEFVPVAEQVSKKKVE